MLDIGLTKTNIMRISVLMPALCLFALRTAAQDGPTIKYGKIAATDLQKKVYSIDSSASAVVLSDVGSTEIVGNAKGGFSLEFKHHKRVHILNKSGYNQADVEISLYSDDNLEEELDNLKAVTYNLDGGKVVETKLEKSAVFKEKKSKNLVVKKFTLPNVKEGSIIEYEYKQTSDFLFNLQPWTFQGSAPRLWSEYRLSMPQFLNYIFLSQGYHPFFIHDQKNRTDNFNVSDQGGTGRSERFSFTAGITEYRWAMKDVPELKEESFTSTLSNHISKIEFQLAGYKEPLTPKIILGSWPELSKSLLEREDFGNSLRMPNGWLGDVVKPLAQGSANDLEKAKKIYAYIRDNINCTGRNGIYMGQQLKNVLKTKSGSEAELNLLLTAMLKYAGLQAEPVILSTSDHGYTYALYPIIDRFNYVVSKVLVDGITYMLDASRPRLGFGKLTADCYNGHARIVNEQATPLEMQPDSLKERKLTSIFITNAENGKWGGTMQQTPGYYESYHIRDKVKEKGQDEFFKEVEKSFGQDIEIKQPAIDSLTTYEQPVTMHYAFDIKTAGEDILYINPMFGEGYKENPFKSASRFYPVEMPYTMDETYLLNMHVPTGYVLDELPKGAKVKLNEEGSGYFEYLISESAGIISMRTRIKLDRTTFSPDEYDSLREFFKLIVTKQSEQVVFKKKK
jgi:hypothetical protein